MGTDSEVSDQALTYTVYNRRDLPHLNQAHMSEVKAIGDKKEEIFNPPDPLWRCDLRQGPADPCLDSIPE